MVVSYGPKLQVGGIFSVGLHPWARNKCPWAGCAEDVGAKNHMWVFLRFQGSFFVWVKVTFGMPGSIGHLMIYVVAIWSGSQEQVEVFRFVGNFPLG